MLIDAHLHIWSLARGDYGWLTPDEGTLFRDYTLHDMDAICAANGVDAVVIVQAAATLAETEYLLEAEAQNERVSGVVGWVDIMSGDAIAQLDHFASRSAFKGIRPMLHDMEDIDWIFQPDLSLLFRRMIALGLSFDALIRPCHMVTIAKLANHYPELPIVIDHAAKPGIAAQQWRSWADDLAALASHPNVSCKCSGLLTEAAPGAGENALRNYVDHIIDMFGQKRVMWGSDWPMILTHNDYRSWRTMARALVPPVMHDDIFGANANHIYRLGLETS